MNRGEIMKEIKIIIEVNDKKLMAKRILEDCTEEQIKQRIDSLIQGVKTSVYIELGLQTITLSNGKEVEIPNMKR
jgi:hypothetical protein